MGPIKEAFTFDDVTLAPNYSEIMPSDVITETNLSKYLTLKIPLLSSAMDTITESKMSIAMAKAGGIGVIHRNLDIKKQISEIRKVKSKNLLVGAAVGAGLTEIKRAKAILKEKIDLIVKEAFKKSGVSIKDIDAVAATAGPGLIVCLAVGLNFGKTFSKSLKLFGKV